MRILLLCLLLILPGIATAQCNGTDLRPSLSLREQAAVAMAEANTPFASGNLWRAERDGQQIHVIGTMHIGDPRMDALSKRLAPLVSAADLMFVEISRKEETRMAQILADDPSLLTLTETTLPDALDAEAWALVAEAARARGLPGFMAAKMQPWYLSVLLSMPACMLAEMATGKSPGLDKLLMDHAEATGTPMRGLERFEEVISIFTSEPFDKQLQFLVAGLTPEQVSADVMATTAESYFDQANAQGWEISRQLAIRHVDLPREEMEQAFDEFKTSLLTNRNTLWMEKISAASERNVVIAVGALHLMDRGGILNLLEQQGYQLTRLPF